MSEYYAGHLLAPPFDCSFWTDSASLPDLVLKDTVGLISARLRLGLANCYCQHTLLKWRVPLAPDGIHVPFELDGLSYRPFLPRPFTPARNAGDSLDLTDLSNPKLGIPEYTMKGISVDELEFINIACTDMEMLNARKSRLPGADLMSLGPLLFSNADLDKALSHFFERYKLYLQGTAVIDAWPSIAHA
ncbi:MAG TPA: hypothetical protein VHE55_10140 [Fimbriimonadaceae bacterium]|nr:hypothetical protein [Fimbriimonadaceae bacterium]